MPFSEWLHPRLRFHALYMDVLFFILYLDLTMHALIVSLLESILPERECHDCAPCVAAKGEARMSHSRAGSYILNHQNPDGRRKTGSLTDTLTPLLLLQIAPSPLAL